MDVTKDIRVEKMWILLDYRALVQLPPPSAVNGVNALPRMAITTSPDAFIHFVCGNKAHLPHRRDRVISGLPSWLPPSSAAIETHATAPKFQPCDLTKFKMGSRQRAEEPHVGPARCLLLTATLTDSLIVSRYVVAVVTFWFLGRAGVLLQTLYLKCWMCII